MREERETFRRLDRGRIRLESLKRLTCSRVKEQRDAQPFIDAASRFQPEVQDRLQREQVTRLQVKQQARRGSCLVRRLVEAAQQAEIVANHATSRAQAKTAQWILKVLTLS